MPSSDVLVVRLGLAALIAFKVFDDLFATALTWAYGAGWLGAARSLGQLTPGDDYERLVPLMAAVPIWLHGLWVLAAVLYGVAAARLLRGAKGAHLPALAALGLEIAAGRASDALLSGTGVVVHPSPNLIVTLVIPYLIPLALIAALWAIDRLRPASPLPAS